MKKILAKKKIVSTTIFVFSMTISNTVTAELYYGGNLGSSVINITKDLSYNQTTETIYSNYMGIRAQGLIGYNFYTFDKGILSQELNKEARCQKFFFSVEFDVNYNFGDVSSSIEPWFLTTNASVEEKQDFSFDLFLLGKYRSAPNTVWFFGPGISRGNFAVSAGQTGGNLGFSGDSTSWLMGWSLKAGVELPLTNALNLVLTYQFTQFNSLSLAANEPLTGNNVATTYKPNVNAFTIGINFNNWSNLFKNNSIADEDLVQKYVVVKEKICMDVYCHEDKVVPVRRSPKIIKRIEKQKVIPKKVVIQQGRKSAMYAEAFPTIPWGDNVFSYRQEEPIPIVQGNEFS